MKILMRSGRTPFENFDAQYALSNNLLGNNSGNFIYAEGVARALMVDDDTVIDSTHYKYRFSGREIARINSEYDCFVIPLACAFRESFVNELNGLTSLVKKLKIPCYVIGVGITGPFEPDLSRGFSFDRNVKRFVSAVLDKSSLIGVRGEITGEYLKRLGFSEGRHYTVIGCPGMYTFGENLTIREKEITSSSPVAFSHSAVAPKEAAEYTVKCANEFENPAIVFQTTKELRLLYAGIPYVNDERPHLCKNVDDRLYKDDKAKFFLNVPTWLDFMRECDFVFGTRFHGNVAAALAGTPSITFAKDARMRELVEYHKLPALMLPDINMDMSIFELIEKTDLKSHLKAQRENFVRYVDFLEENGIKNIFSGYKSPKEAPYDRKLANTKLEGTVKSLVSCQLSEISERFVFMQSLIDSEKQKLSKLKNAIEKQAQNVQGGKWYKGFFILRILRRLFSLIQSRRNR